MKRILIFCAAALVLAAPQTYAGVFSANFNECSTLPCTPPLGSAVYGTTVIEPTGGVGDSGVLKLTKALPSQQGSFVIDDLDAGQPVNGFDLRFKLRMGGGGATPADGFSFSAAPNLPAGTWGEEGTGGGLSVAFDIYDNAGGEAPSIDIKWPGATVLRETRVPISFLRTTNAYVDVQIRLDADGSLDVVYNGTPIYTDLLLPGFQPTGALKYGFGGRTGGAFEDQWIDDLQLTTTTGTLAPRFLRQPADARVREGGSLTLRAEINDPTQVFSYQWFRRGATDPGFTAIGGATDTNYTAGPLTLADNGSQYVLRATTTEGEFSSRTATVSVVSIPVPPATTTYNFNDGAIPAGTAVYGNPIPAVTSDGGVGGSGVLRLTEAVNSQSGTFIINDLNAGQAVEAITVTFRPRVGGSTARPPADGFSFSWANNLPDANFALGEEGAGNGLIVSFDIYEGAASPVVDVRYNGTNIASTPVALDMIETGDEFGDAIIQLRADGRVYVIYNDVVLHNGVQIPGWSALGGARYAFAARTGGLNEAHYIDDIGITTTLFSGPLSFTRQPANAAVVTGQTATFSAEVNDPARSTFQWQAQASAGGAFTNIPGATASTYVTPALTAANNATRFHLVATGPINTVTSDDVTLTVVNVSRPTSPDVTYDFNDCLVEPCAPPAGTMTNGTARITPTGGTAGSGVLHITDALNDQNGSWAIEDFMGGQAVGGFTLAFNAYIDDGNPANPPADGYSVSWGTDIPNGLLNPAEEGAGTGLIVSFDLWNSSAAGQPAEAPAIDLKWRGQTVAHKLVPTATIETGSGTFKEVLVRLEPDGTVDVVYGGELIHNNVAISNHTSLAGARFVFAGRTGGANENQWIDDVAIDAVLFTGPITFIQEPADTVVLAGSTATFSATVNDPARSTFQWQARAPGGSTFTNIAGATSSSFTTPALALGDSGTDLRLIATATSNTLTSRVARLTVITIPQPTPTVAYDFDDGLLPPGTVIVTSAGPPAGAGTIDPTAGVNGSGGLKLTVSPGAGHVASFIVDDLNAGAPVYGMTASFDTRIGGGTTPPADGMSFVWASDLPNNAAFGEDGLGSGLTVTFDIYDNGGGEAPAIDVTYRGTVIASTKVPITLLDTGDGYVPTIIRVENDGTLDVVYDNQVIYHNLSLPGFTNVVGGRFGWGARTGGLSANQWIDNIQIATSTTPAPRLTISHTGNNVTVSWNAGQLQSAPAITGPWTTMAGATSPLTLNNTTGMQFFRTISP
jgi:hypothetical protein